MIRNNNLVAIEEKIYRKILDSEKKDKKIKRRTSPTSAEILITGLISIMVILFAVGAVYYYNVFIDLESDVDANLAQIDTQLQKRKNLIIYLGKTVAEYSKHEKGIFTHIADIRTIVSGSNSEMSLEDIQNQLKNTHPGNAKLGKDLEKWENTLSRLMAIAEQYPDLKLSENFRTFMDAILEFEGTIAELRMTYNDSVNEYSTIKAQIPGCLYAFIFGFKDYPYFLVDENARGFIPIE